MEILEEDLSEKEIEEEVIKAGASERVGVLDPDFVLIFLFALFVDSVDIILFILKILGLATGILAPLVAFLEIVSKAMDVTTFFIIGAWIYWRTGRIVKRKREQKKVLQKAITKRGAAMEKQLARGMRGPLRRALTRGGIACLGEIIPIIGLIPFWTISVVSTLNEK